MTGETILVDTPAEHVGRITLNRPEKTQRHLDGDARRVA